MIVFYAGYCVVLKFNTPLERWAYSLKLPIKLPSKEEQSALVTFKNVPDVTYSGPVPDQPKSADSSPDQQPEPHKQPQQQYQGYNETNE